MLSLIEAAAGEPQALRGYLPIGGRSIARHQIGVALALGCTRVVVLADALTGELVSLQHTAEQAGARFHVIAAQRALIPLVAPDDELFVFSDGLLPMPADALRLLGQGPVILTQPVETGLGAGFERIDINDANAGAMCLPGRIVANLGELPSDWNPVSALLRIAVQGRVPQRRVPPALVEQGRWRLIRNEAEALRAEPEWLQLHTVSNHPRSPGEWLAARSIQLVGPALLHAGTRPYVIGLAALITALLGIGLGWFGWITAGFALLGFAWLQVEVAGLLVRIEQASLLAGSSRIPAAALARYGLDIAIVALAAWRTEIPAVAGVPVGIAWFAAAVLVLLLHLLPRVLPDRAWLWYLKDRFLCAGVLAVTSAVLPFDLMVRSYVLGLVIAALVASPARPDSSNAELTGPD
ncbi:hypothetical protein [Novosphingobium sp.]|uniref:hypothetical protein n=1 Tax=Novosphingobium sp. TaxID=1874826 RepID=UPI0038BB7C81